MNRRSSKRRLSGQPPLPPRLSSGAGGVLSWSRLATTGPDASVPRRPPPPVLEPPLGPDHPPPRLSRAVPSAPLDRPLGPPPAAAPTRTLMRERGGKGSAASSLVLVPPALLLKLSLKGWRAITPAAPMAGHWKSSLPSTRLTLPERGLQGPCCSATARTWESEGYLRPLINLHLAALSKLTTEAAAILRVPGTRRSGVSARVPLAIVSWIQSH